MKGSFYSEKNAKIFASMSSLMDQKIPIDLTTVTSDLKNKKVLSEVGGVEYLTEVLNFVPTAANIDYYIKTVEDTAILRSLIAFIYDVSGRCGPLHKSVKFPCE